VRAIIAFVCGTYWVLLTVLLLAPNPVAVVGVKKVPFISGTNLGVHFVAFTILASLVHGSRWLERSGWAFLVLALYALGSEALQAFVPSRCVSLEDFFENLIGVAAGSAIYWCVCRAVALDSSVAVSTFPDEGDGSRPSDD
jgi:VanZ family protein